MILRRAVLYVGVACALMLPGLARAQQASADKAAVEAAVLKTDADWEKAAQLKQSAAWMAFYSDDAVVMPPNDKIATDKAGIKNVLDNLFVLPALQIGWKTDKVEASSSGDLAYTRGTYSVAFADPNGNQISDHGKYLAIWKKQADGSWKCIVDTWNSDLPP
jgi:ketosteroid isomerase-like protein